MTPSGVEHMTRTDGAPGSPRVAQTMTPSGVEHKQKAEIQIQLARGGPDDDALGR